MPSRRGLDCLCAAVLVAAVCLGSRAAPALAAAPRVVDQRPVAIPGVMLLGLAPTGRWLLGERRPDDGSDHLCSYEVTTLAEVACADLVAAGYRDSVDGNGLDRMSVAWSPDGEWIAFTESAATVRESDLWTFELARGTLANLTDDGVVGEVGFGPVDPAATVDRWPAWSPDGGTIAFARAKAITDVGSDVGLYRIDVATGVVEQMAALPRVTFVDFVDVVRWLPDGRVVYEVWDPESDYRTIWKLDGAGGEQSDIVTLMDDIMLDLSAQGTALLWFIPSSAGSPTYVLVDLATDAVSLLETPGVRPAYPRTETLVAFAPDGSVLLYAAGDGEAPPTRLEWVGLDGGGSGTLVEGLDLWHEDPAALGLTWAADDTVFVPAQPTDGQAGGTLLRLATGGAGSPAAEPNATPA